MAQGTIKARPKTTSATSKPKSKSGITRKGTQNLPPKKSAALKKQKKMTHKLSSGLVTQTEKMLGERAGYLEMIGGGRKRDGTVGGSGGKDGKGKKGK